MPSCWNGTLASRVAATSVESAGVGFGKSKLGGVSAVGYANAIRKRHGILREAKPKLSSVDRQQMGFEELGSEDTVVWTRHTIGNLRSYSTRRSITEHWLICSFAPSFGGSSAVIGTQCCAGWPSHFGREKRTCSAFGESTSLRTLERKIEAEAR